MKKLIIGALVGGILIFICQFLSWGLLNLHGAQQTYTPKQDSVMQYLNSQFSEDGFYFMPNHKPDATHEEMEACMKESQGKPWVQLFYHKAMNMSMTSNMVRGFVVDVLTVALLCLILARFNKPSFGTILLGSLYVGLIGFLNISYTHHIWYETADVMAHFTDAIVSWGLCGIWLGWWLRRN